MSTMQVYTHEFRESAVGPVLSLGLSIRVAAEDLGKFVWTRSYKVIEVPKKGVVEAFSTITIPQPDKPSSMNFSN